MAHLNEYEGVTSLSEKSKLNLMNWYSQDIEFYKLCENWILEKSQNYNLYSNVLKSSA